MAAPTPSPNTSPRQLLPGLATEHVESAVKSKRGAPCSQTGNYRMATAEHRTKQSTGHFSVWGPRDLPLPHQAHTCEP